MERNPEKLTCVSMVICDDIYRDEHTKKLIIVGAFNNISAPSMPCRHPRMHVLLTLTNGQGKYDVSLSIEHEETGHKVIEIRGPLKIENPLSIQDMNVILQDVGFQQEGKYWVVLRADEEIIQQRPFTVSKRSERKDEK